MGTLNKPIFIALDCDNFLVAKAIIDQTHKLNNYYKIGLESFYSMGPEVLGYLESIKATVFLDLKLHDIPTTVYKTLRVLLSHYKVDFINIHALGGLDMMIQAKKAVLETNAKTKLLAVTILTSHDQLTLEKELNINSPLKDTVLKLTTLAIKAKLDGVVASAEEATIIKENSPKNFIIVTPGIRFNKISHDQKRIVTPKEAFKNGSTHIVMGREISQSFQPNVILKNIQESLYEPTTTISN